MSGNALAVQGLTKRYKDFVLDNVSFVVPRGAIVGLVGENGAGKSTTLHAILGLIHRDGGSVELLGREDTAVDEAFRNQIGVVFDGSSYPETLTPRKLNRVFQSLYQGWDEAGYFALLEQLSLPADKKIKAFSKGMKMKLSLAVAFSHGAKLLVLDEATSGLDPVVRDDILDLCLGFVQEEDRAILVSSHITSDLEKVADYIVFLHKGRVVFCKPKDELRYHYGILRCGAAQFEAIDKGEVLAWRRQDYSGRSWWPTGPRPSGSIPRRWWTRPPLTRSCCSM